MTSVRELQSELGVTADGIFGPQSKVALLARFTNLNAKAITEAQIASLADRLQCTAKQIKAVAAVESSGSGFDRSGKPKILYERHMFHRLTDGKWSVTSYSNPTWGGYKEGSWDKLAAACAKDPDAAFGACSWGKFQVLGLHWSKLGYASSYALAVSTVESEMAHYDLLARYIEAFGLKDELRALSTDPDDCRAFANAYNGPAYQRHDYHTKLAKAMA